MATNFVRDGKKMQMPTATGAKSGDAFVIGGSLPCVLLTDAEAAAPYNATVQTEGVFDLSVTGEDGTGSSAVVVGDMLYWTDKDTALNKDSSKDAFGIALEAVGSGETDTINVLLG
jgi:predicted RecA/RadA family phage recombinase